MSPWLRRAAISVTIVAVVVLALPQALRLILFRDGLPVGIQERFGVTATVQNFGWRTLDISPLTWGPPGEETIEITSATIKYTPSGLLNQNLDDITLSGLTIHVIRGDNGLRLRGPAVQPKTPSSPDATSSGSWNIPIPFQQLDISSARIRIHDPASTTTDIPFHVLLTRDADQPRQVHFKAELLDGTPTSSSHGVLDLANSAVRAEFSCPLTTLTKFMPKITVPEAAVSGRYDLSLNQQGRWTLSIDATLSGPTAGSALSVSLPKGQVVASPIHMHAQGEGQGKKGEITLDATVDRLDAAPVTIQRLGISLPWRWPLATPAETSGRITIASMSLDNKEIGTLNIAVHQTGDISGKLDGTFTGSANFPSRAEIKASASLDPNTSNTQFLFSLIVPSLDLKAFDWKTLSNLIQSPPKESPAVDLAGVINASITAQGDNNNHTAKATLNITDGGLTMTKENVEISGVSGKIRIPNLWPEHAGLQGEATVRKATIGEILLTDGEIQFHADEKENLVIERVMAGWSGGTIHAEDLSFTKNNSNLTGELYCDKLDLAQLLSQLGIPQVSGKGTITGRIPLEYINGKVQITNGLLTSAPGGGSLHFFASDLITGGVPSGSPQFSQLQFAAAALEDFTYNQLSVGLESKGEEMTIAMSVDGHPAKPLPFRYDARLGTFTKITGSGEIGINQPVKLDVNFRLPFNELLGYGKSIKNVRDQLR